MAEDKSIGLGPSQNVGVTSVDYTQDERMADMLARLQESRTPRQQRAPTEFDRLVQEQLDQSRAQSFLTPYEAPDQQMFDADITISNPLDFLQSAYQDPNLDLQAVYDDFMENKYTGSRDDRKTAYGIRTIADYSGNVRNREGGGPLNIGLNAFVDPGEYGAYLPEAAYEYAGGFTPTDVASGAINPEALSFSISGVTGKPGSEGYGDYDVAYETGVSRLPQAQGADTDSGFSIETSPEYQAYIDKLSNTLLSGFDRYGYKVTSNQAGTYGEDLIRNPGFSEYGRPQDYGSLATMYNEYMAANPNATEGDFVTSNNLNFKVFDSLQEASDLAPENFAATLRSSGGVRNVFEGTESGPGFLEDVSYKDPDLFSSTYYGILNRPKEIVVDGTAYPTSFTSNAYYSWMPGATLGQMVASGNAYNALADPEYFIQNAHLFKDNPFVTIDGTIPDAPPSATTGSEGPRKTYAEYAKELAQNRRAGILGLAPELI